MTHPRGERHATHLLLPVSVGATPAPGASVWGGDLWLAGWDIVEATGLATATVQLIDGNDATGQPISPTYVLAANAGLSRFLGGHLLAVRSGVFLRVTAGSASATIYAADR